MRLLFSGKKKLLTISVVGLIALTFLPFTIGLSFLWFVYKKVANKRLRYIAFVIIGFFTLFIGSAWVVNMTSPSNTLSIQPTKTIEPEKTITQTPTLSPSQMQSHNVNLTNNQEAKVIRVVDGDTLTVTVDGKTETVRVIGIDTPETLDPRKPVQCFGKEASDKAKSLLTNQIVQLESDPTQDERDKYQRLLRFVWLNNNTTDFGKQMIIDGYAHEYTYNTPYKYQAEYKKANTEAMNAKRGLWADTTCAGNTSTQTQIKAMSTPKPLNQQPITITNSRSQVNANSHSCTGPDLDCSDFSTHSEAQTFFDGCGFTANNDPMKLDGIKVDDGIACESLP